MNARTEWRKIQEILGTAQDGIPGPNDDEALTRLRLHARLDTEKWEPLQTTSAISPIWHEGHASSFADPADVRAFRRCKAQGKSDSECFKVGDNGIGKWGMDTTQPVPMCALPPEDWQILTHPPGTVVIVEANGQTVRAELQDTMPHRANITNGAIIDLNPAACAALGMEPPLMVKARWRWA